MKAALCGAAVASCALGAPAEAKGWQCATFARAFSGIELFGAAHSWWQKAIGKYAEGMAPKIGSVLVFKAIGATRSGHVATVTQIVGDRIIKVTHANWSPINGRRGQIEHDVSVIDTSDGNDWSRVKVWYAPSKDLGTRQYPTYGFIYAGAAPARSSATVKPGAHPPTLVAPPIKGLVVVARNIDTRAG